MEPTAPPSPFRPYPFEFRRHAPPPADLADESALHPVAIVGGGIAGLTLALGLAVQGVPSVVIEADDSVCFGSRAICFSRRSLEIFERLGVLEPIVSKGLAWTGGRSYYRNTEVLQFQMPHDRLQKLPPMINLQQYWVEEILVRALEAPLGSSTCAGSRAWSRCDEAPDHVALTIEQRGPPVHRTGGLGGRVRRRPQQRARSARPSPRRHRVRRPLRGGRHRPRLRPANRTPRLVRPTVQPRLHHPDAPTARRRLAHRLPVARRRGRAGRHRAGERAAARGGAPAHDRAGCGPGRRSDHRSTRQTRLTLPGYRHGRFLFAGDAAHLVPIFGVRGANSTIDDADNLAWKLAAVVKGGADARLLDSYSMERVRAAHENLAYGRKSTHFMAPPDFAFRTMREAVLGLAVDTPALRPLINPRQSSPVRYDASPLNAMPASRDGFAAGPAAGAVLPEMPVRWLEPSAPGRTLHDGHLTDALRAGAFTLIAIGAQVRGENPDVGALPSACRALCTEGIAARFVEVLPGSAQASSRARSPHDPAGQDVALNEPDALGLDLDGGLVTRYGVPPAGALYAVRPDGHVLGRWAGRTEDVATRAVAAIRRCLAGGADTKAEPR